MLGFFSKLARAPWWIFAALAAVFAYFGFAPEGMAIAGFDLTPPEIEILPTLVKVIPDLAPAVEWLESMGFQHKSALSGFGGSLGGSSEPFGGSSRSFGGGDDSFLSSRAQIFAAMCGGVAIYKLLFGGPPRTNSEGFLDDPKINLAMLKHAPAKISNEAWENPLAVPTDEPVAQVEEPSRLRITPRDTSQKTKPTRRKAAPQKATRAKMFGRKRVVPDNSPERKALDEIFRAKMEEDPFEKLVRWNDA